MTSTIDDLPVHVGSDPDEATGTVIPAIYKQAGIGSHKVRINASFQIAS
jgi:hypothetical protein